jgi:hypothetical protein
MLAGNPTMQINAGMNARNFSRKQKQNPVTSEANSKIITNPVAAPKSSCLLGDRCWQ